MRTRVDPPPEKRPHGWRLAKAGATHPRSKAVITPAGRFPNATQAGAYHGISRQAAARRARDGILGWFYSDYHWRAPQDAVAPPRPSTGKEARP